MNSARRGVSEFFLVLRKITLVTCHFRLSCDSRTYAGDSSVLSGEKKKKGFRFRAAFSEKRKKKIVALCFSFNLNAPASALEHDSALAPDEGEPS